MAEELKQGGTVVAQTQTQVQAQSETPEPINKFNASPEVESRFKSLASELRCLVCQNQSLADSHAGLAEDLKLKVYQQIATGKSDAEIKSYMVERYGEFILYKPSFSNSNAVLWMGPFVILLIAIVVARSWLKANAVKAKTQTVPAPTAANAELEKLYQQTKR
ncbi:MAG: cytochrome c-type biogenesis protein CcmH [Burkholderiales bacterium]|nr:cytochrome c-type biogenesis protein CcmH [Burkholderiales bacterium]